MVDNSFDIPSFDDLPYVEGMKHGCAWGVFDKDGKKDVLGTLNLLTPNVVSAALAEVGEGVSISLNWPLTGIKALPIKRKLPKHRVTSLRDLGMDAHGWDDELEFNTQCSSQWDSLCHYNHQASGLAYNGFIPTHNELSKPTTADINLPTLDHWHARGGVVGRGVLIDYKQYAEAKGIPFSPFEGKKITVREMEEVAQSQGVQFQRGDILLLRTGFTAALGACETGEQQLSLLGNLTMSGADPSVEMAKWLWDKHFAAVAGDVGAFEAVVPGSDGNPPPIKEWLLHEWLLTMFGMPIGEMWDLERLSVHCKKTGKYSFLLTSAPLNVPGLVGSPPNALAIF